MLSQVAAFVEILGYILFRGPQYLRTHENQWHAAGLQAVRSDAESELRFRLGPRRNGQWSPLAAPSSPEVDYGGQTEDDADTQEDDDDKNEAEEDEADYS